MTGGRERVPASLTAGQQAAGGGAGAGAHLEVGELVGVVGAGDVGGVGGGHVQQVAVPVALAPARPPPRDVRGRLVPDAGCVPVPAPPAPPPMIPNQRGRHDGLPRRHRQQPHQSADILFPSPLALGRCFCRRGRGSSGRWESVGWVQWGEGGGGGGRELGGDWGGAGGGRRKGGAPFLRQGQIQLIVGSSHDVLPVEVIHLHTNANLRSPVADRAT